MLYSSQEIEARAVVQIAEMMCAAARTAPKARGVDNLVTTIVDGEEKTKLAIEMRRIAKESGAQFFERDANCLDRAPLVVLFGQKVKPLGVSPCGFCGYENCGDCAKGTGLCAVSTGDLGIALGSAAGVAALHHADSRIMFSIGKAAVNLGLLGEEVRLVYGIPLSISGKSPFFDR